ncbi:FAD-dependent oxidoreductase [Adhaeribacter radiodurans]|uniref:FAD-dependent oxidoreductase n=1 Tax=Adhaeribacter radiodurans TaxID=2745197 RepID=A0A7L7L3J6_9BACT|nr:FAD-dependent oxidoreductase [Adhaeribacter radiodurans]QMU27367.1 FAD-dependent oxidoreductase [Adhaeribacter radiodurans]
MRWFLQNESDINVYFKKYYSSSYTSNIPKEEECQNLFLPDCLSNSQIDYGSICIKLAFIILEQSAADATGQAIDANVAMQNVDDTKLKAQLLKDKQKLEL